MRTVTMFLLLLAALACAAPGRALAAPVNYDEAVNGDLDQANPPTFTVDVGVNVWTGTIGPTPTSNTQDAFFLILSPTLQITHVSWLYSANQGDQSSFDVSGPPDAAPPFGTVLSHQVKKAGDNLTDTGFSTVNPILPVTVTGLYKCEVTTNFAITQATWKITLTVESIPVPARAATWGHIKALYD